MLRLTLRNHVGRFTHSMLAFAMVILGLALPPDAAAASSGVFRVTCDLSHRAQADPIVSPGVKSAHLHDFFGNDTTGKDSKYLSMVGRSTSCRLATDTAAFWVPTLLDKQSDPVPVLGASIYYRDLPDSGHPVTAYSPDFRIIAGFPAARHHRTALRGGRWGWTCDNTMPLRGTSQIDCAGWENPYVQAVVVFPSCGKLDSRGKIVTDSVDHRSHAAYAVDSGCSARYPVKLPFLYIKVKYDLTDCIDAGCHLSSDGMQVDGQMCSAPGCSLHADFWNTWVQGPASKDGTLTNLVQTCLNSDSGTQCNA